jgi:hypothetical protein
MELLKEYTKIIKPGKMKNKKNLKEDLKVFGFLLITSIVMMQGIRLMIVTSIM